MQSESYTDRAQISKSAPSKPIQFAAVGMAVMRGTAHIATAISHTMAKRIARALNQHQPNSRGV